MTGGSSQFPLTASALAMGQGGNTFVLSPFFHENVENPLVESVDIDNDGDMDLLFRNLILRNDLQANSVPGNIQREKVTVSPNPGADKIVIISSLQVEEVILTTLNGKWVKTIHPDIPVKELQVENLAAGIYIAMIRISGNEMISKKIVVIRN